MESITMNPIPSSSIKIDTSDWRTKETENIFCWLEAPMNQDFVAEVNRQDNPPVGPSCRLSIDSIRV
jgi:hypothetical protein